MLVTILGVRSKLVELIPRSVMLATAAGIGALVWGRRVHWLVGSRNKGSVKLQGGVGCLCPPCTSGAARRFTLCLHPLFSPPLPFRPVPELHRPAGLRGAPACLGAQLCLHKLVLHRVADNAKQHTHA